MIPTTVKIKKTLKEAGYSWRIKKVVDHFYRLDISPMLSGKSRFWGSSNEFCLRKAWHCFQEQKQLQDDEEESVFV